MTMHTIFFKENEGIFSDPIISSQPEAPMWSVIGSQSPLPTAAYDNSFLQSKMTRNLQLGVDKESDQLLAKKDNTHFTTGDRRTAENGTKVTHYHTIPSLQVAPMEYRQQLKLGLGQPLICAQYPYKSEQCYGIYSAYGAQIEGQRMMLPVSDGGPIFVNAKQYNGIMRRRQSRARAEAKINEVIKVRKPYMHLSRHLHAVRRQRGSGGRFLRTKSSKKKAGYDRQPQSTESEMSEAHSTKTNISSNSRGSEATSYLHQFEFDGHDHVVQPSFQYSFLDVGIGNNYLKV